MTSLRQTWLKHRWRSSLVIVVAAVTALAVALSAVVSRLWLDDEATRDRLDPSFQRGITIPRQIGTQSYTAADATWASDIGSITPSTGADWVQIAFVLTQPDSSSTQPVVDSALSATPDSLLAGIRAAHAHQLKVFVVPLLLLSAPEQLTAWRGTVDPGSSQWYARWFSAYRTALDPYLTAAQAGGAEQFAVGTELEALEANAPAPAWTSLIASIRSAYSGRLTYDMNWSSMARAVPGWMRDPTLSALGVSDYTPLTSSGGDTAESVRRVWDERVGTLLDQLHERSGRPIFLSEVGFRYTENSFDQRWLEKDPVNSTLDLHRQAMAFDAVLAAVAAKPWITGVFCWGWVDVGQFQLKGTPAAATIKAWFR